MSIELTKGDRFNISKEAPDFNKIAIALGWQVSQTAQNYDIDASVFMLGADGRIPDEKYFVFYNNLTSPDGAVRHSGDNTTGQVEGDDETVYVDLSLIDAAVEEIVFVVTIHDGQEKKQNFSQVINAFIRLYNFETGSELVRYNLKEVFSQETALEFGRLYRKNGEWRFQAVGQGYNTGLQSFVDKYHVAKEVKSTENVAHKLDDAEVVRRFSDRVDKQLQEAAGESVTNPVNADHLKAEEDVDDSVSESQESAISAEEFWQRCREGERDFRGVNLAGVDLSGNIMSSPISFSQANLSNANLSNANLQGANLIGANLKGANLHATNLQQADLIQANFSNANLTKANLSYARLIQANFKEAEFSCAQLVGANLTAANLIRANLTQASLNSANLTGADLTQANIKKASLIGANLTGVKLTGVSFAGVDLMNVNLKVANLTGASFVGTNLQANNLRGLDLRGVNLVGVSLVGVNLDLVNLSGQNLSGFNLCGISLIRANLSEANLNLADLRGANLMMANLEKANLKQANLAGANLTEAKMEGAKLTGAIMPDGKTYERTRK
ncbi:TerD family protein [Microcoleus sp. bin38.metabat.b11b12b14.051]|uniref:TerD family protein n=1 Tax=Microcoleus sp. bin38.metabat.b11b12b14.051 TaxID=2742709 RepID=UPI0025E38398|nr:TerD family protein [Microcoleus sp. bin38.metabat.b11b12b14.051]